MLDKKLTLMPLDEAEEAYKYTNTEAKAKTLHAKSACTILGDNQDTSRWMRFLRNPGKARPSNMR